MDANNYFLPKNGVYGVIIVIDGKRYLGMANLGYNPTFNVLTKVSLEVNIFDFDQDVYGKYVTVFFIKKIRYEKRFNSIGELINQLNQDRKQIKNEIQLINE